MGSAVCGVEAEGFLVAGHDPGPVPPHVLGCRVVRGGGRAGPPRPAVRVCTRRARSWVRASMAAAIWAIAASSSLPALGRGELGEGVADEEAGVGFGASEPPVQDGGDVVGVVEVPAGRGPGEGGGAVDAGRVEDPQPGGQGRPGRRGDHCAGQVRLRRWRRRRSASGRRPAVAMRSCQMGNRVLRLRARSASSAWTARAARSSGRSSRSQDGGQYGQGVLVGAVAVGAFGSGADHVGPVLFAPRG